ncbi:MAG: multicopper oxidase family protein [Gemmatimonadetes bacterium]|nr:multicopper oxidase family protein [Gemmatimonadota bacterium]
MSRGSRAPSGRALAAAGLRAAATAVLLFAPGIGLLVAVPPAAAQEMDHAAHMMHEMDGGWRMPPMDPNMPMIPGLEMALPPVEPFLAAAGIDVMTLPEARPSEVVHLAAGDTFDVDVTIVRRTLRGHTAAMYGYNGQYPGPLIRAPQGSRVVVRVTNRIESPTTVHWHGLRLENRFDGVETLTQDPIEVGESFTYELHVPDAGMFWYHPHMREDVQQDLGLYGNLLVSSPDPDYYGPAHREEMLVLDDILMDDQGLIPWGREAPTHALMGRFGNVMLVNGVTGHALQVRPGEVVRFFMTNVANSRTFNVTFGSARVKLVASDLGRFERETWVSSVVIAPAERYVVDVVFPKEGEVAVANTIQAINHFRGEFYPHVDTLALVTVAGPPVADEVTEAYATLRGIEEVAAEAEAMRGHHGRAPDYTLEATVRVQGLPLPIIRSMEMDTLYIPPMEWNDAMPMMNWLSSGTQVTWVLRDLATGRENDDIHWTFQRGDLVKIRVFNSPDSFHPMNHPIHVHGQRFVVLARDDVPNDNLVWKDTAILPVGSTMDILVEMSNPGDWMLHCHIAEHLSAGMMFHFTVEE